MSAKVCAFLELDVFDLFFSSPSSLEHWSQQIILTLKKMQRLWRKLCRDLVRKKALLVDHWQQLVPKLVEILLCPGAIFYFVRPIVHPPTHPSPRFNIALLPRPWPKHVATTLQHWMEEGAGLLGNCGLCCESEQYWLCKGGFGRQFCN